MTSHDDDIGRRLGFIDRTIDHALRACHSDDSVPEALRYEVEQLGRRATQARHAYQLHDVPRLRQSVDDLARLSDQAQHRIHPSDGVNYDVKSAVILAHIELSALRYQLN